jgi:hypothetical protein
VLVKDQPSWCENRIAKSQFTLGCEPKLPLTFFQVAGITVAIVRG